MSEKLTLKDVTLVCVDGSLNSKNSKQVFERVANQIDFSDLFFSDAPNSLIDYNDFLINKLSEKVKTTHCLIIQADGYPINLKAWDEAFLKYDYIGAPWYTQPWPLEKTVGNGGFSLRSKKMLEESSKLNYDKHCNIPEDVFLCRVQDANLKSKGIKFAPHDIAYRFAVEDMYYKGQFGFHGKQTLNMNIQAGVFK
jgi:hypothetical protein